MCTPVYNIYYYELATTNGDEQRRKNIPLNVCVNVKTSNTRSHSNYCYLQLL